MRGAWRGRVGSRSLACERQPCVAGIVMGVESVADVEIRGRGCWDSHFGGWDGGLGVEGEERGGMSVYVSCVCYFFWGKRKQRGKWVCRNVIVHPSGVIYIVLLVPVTLNLSRSAELEIGQGTLLEGIRRREVQYVRYLRLFTVVATFLSSGE